jgi:transcriptional regulator GlxA family with amidase domain
MPFGEGFRPLPFSGNQASTIRTAIKRVQLERTRRLVMDTDLPLKQIAVETGFRSVQHMTTLYVRAFDVTPARHRRQSAPS